MLVQVPNTGKSAEPRRKFPGSETVGTKWVPVSELGAAPRPGSNEPFYMPLLSRRVMDGALAWVETERRRLELRAALAKSRAR